MPLVPGTTLGPYDVTAKIGEGGMGEVYRARDTKLDRDVALKVLPQAFTDDPDRLARFEREAKVLASLNHPNIGGIHGLEESEGVKALVLEYIEGPTLADRIKQGPIPVDEALPIAKQIAEALEAAHEQGIIHRDLKPANIKVKDDGTVKVLDFGLAKAAVVAGADATASPTLTAETAIGTILGTAAYMSPEQARAAPLDRRSDIWSLGIILYEMVSGARPFTGDSTITVLSAILKDDPPPLAGLSSRLASVLSRCLSKDPGARFQTADDLAAALSKPDPMRDAGVGSVPSVVVRAFRSSGHDEELAAFAEGLCEDTIGGLSQFSHLSVVAEGSEDCRGVRFAVEGTVRKAGSRIRVNVKLLNCATGAHLWAEQFDRDLGANDVFTLQDELTDRIVATLADPSGVLTRSLVALVKKKPTESLSAADCVLRMCGYVEHWRRDEHRELRTACESAVAREPEHADAWASLSELYLDEHRWHFNPKPDSLGRSLRAAQRAVELDATSALASGALASVQYFRREFGAFRAAADRAFALNPRDTSGVAMLAVFLQCLGEWDQAKSLIDRAEAMNPHHAGWFYWVSFWDHYHHRRYDDALEVAEKINMPGFPWTHGCLAVVQAQLGEKDAARRHIEDFLALSPKYGKFARQDISKWWQVEEHVEEMLEALSMAGLEIDE